MCGISGIVNFNDTAVGETSLRAMMSEMKHRGPDDDGTFTEKNLGLGFVRLSIIDLSAAGHQPMFSHDERFVMIFNGEIYNYLELKETLIALGFHFKTKTDTEVLLTAYQAWGEDMLHRLNGMFAFVIYDRNTRELFGARDRYGIKPFYYCWDKDRFIFASEIPCILKVLGRKPSPDMGAIFDFLVFDRTDQTNNTFFQEIKKLNHGYWFKFNLTPRNAALEFTPHKWYDIRKELKTPFQSPEEYREAFYESLRLRLRSDVPIGVCLSGGLDSSSIVSGLVEEHQMKDLNTFSAIYGQGKTGDESEFINLFQGKLKNMHFTYPDEQSLHRDISAFVFAHGEPVPSTSPYAQFKVMELAKQHVTVTLDGQGADEKLAGYHYFFGFHFKQLLLNGRLGKLSSELYYYFKNHRSLYGFKSFLFFMLPAYQRTFVRALEKGYLDRDFLQTFAPQRKVIVETLYGSSNVQESLINHFEHKLEHLLKWEDSNSMWFSIEARVPFLDHHLVERTLSLPEDQIIDKGETKRILREATKGLLPEKIRVRQDKMGFGTPQDDWFRTPVFQSYITELIHSDTFASRTFMDINKVKKIYQDHLKGRGNHAKIIWKWIHLENWYRQFID